MPHLFKAMSLTFIFLPVHAYEAEPHPHKQGYHIINCDDGHRVVLKGSFRFHYKALDKCGEFQQSQPSRMTSDVDENEALALCWKNSASQWLCDGRIQRTNTSHSLLQVQLNAVGCDHPRKQATLLKGTLFYCGYMLDDRVAKTKNTWNRDIRLWHKLD